MASTDTSPSPHRGPAYIIRGARRPANDPARIAANAQVIGGGACPGCGARGLVAAESRWLGVNVRRVEHAPACPHGR